jgi:hypothetical protein
MLKFRLLNPGGGQRQFLAPDALHLGHPGVGIEFGYGEKWSQTAGRRFFTCDRANLRSDPLPREAPWAKNTEGLSASVQTAAARPGGSGTAVPCCLGMAGRARAVCGAGGLPPLPEASVSIVRTDRHLHGESRKHDILDSGEMIGVFQQRLPFAKQTRASFLLTTSRWDNRSVPGEDFGACRQIRRSGHRQCAWQNPGDPGPPFGA